MITWPLSIFVVRRMDKRILVVLFWMLLEMKGRKKMQNTIRFGVGLKVGEIPTAVDKETKKSRIHYILWCIIKFMLISLTWQNYENNDYDLNVMFSRVAGDSIGNKYWLRPVHKLHKCNSFNSEQCFSNKKMTVFLCYYLQCTFDICML